MQVQVQISSNSNVFCYFDSVLETHILTFLATRELTISLLELSTKHMPVLVTTSQPPLSEKELDKRFGSSSNSLINQSQENVSSLSKNWDWLVAVDRPHAVSHNQFSADVKLVVSLLSSEFCHLNCYWIVIMVVSVIQFIFSHVYSTYPHPCDPRIDHPVKLCFLSSTIYFQSCFTYPLQLPWRELNQNTISNNYSNNYSSGLCIVHWWFVHWIYFLTSEENFYQGTSVLHGIFSTVPRAVSLTARHFLLCDWEGSVTGSCYQELQHPCWIFSASVKPLR